jgi:hypothetical protein
MNSQRSCENVILTGFVEHRLDFSSETQTQGRKKRRILNESQTDQNIGFFFIHDDTCGGGVIKDENKSAIRLIMPQLLIKDICNAAIYNLKVKLEEYSVVSGTNESEGFQLIQLFHGGLTVLEPQVATLNCDLTSSLSEMQKVEENIEKDRLTKKKHKIMLPGSKSSSQRFNFRGTVDAISPIITIVPSDPFALIELYDNQNPTITAVVILKGIKALHCHPAILPGDTLGFLNVARSRWHVPQSFQKKGVPTRFASRASSHVFVVSETKSVQWSCDDKRLGTFNITTLPSTIHTLSSIQGKVLSIDYLRPRDNSDSQSNDKILYITVEGYKTSDRCPSYFKLYLTYYPMSPTFFYSLSIGAYICAYNVHPIHLVNVKASGTITKCHNNEHSKLAVFGACLRSTLTLLEYSDDVGHAQIQYPRTKIPRGQFYAFRNIQTSYLEQEWMSNIYQENSFRSLNCPSDEIYHRLKECLLKNIGCKDALTSCKRDPYKEWFDHACEANNVSDIEDGDSNVTLCSRNQLISCFPTVMNLSRIKSMSIGKMTEWLSKCHFFTKDKNSTTFAQTIGWTKSIVIRKNEFVDKRYIEIVNKLYVGGMISEECFEPKSLYHIHDGKCQIPVVLSAKRTSLNAHLDPHQTDFFALAQIDGVIVSAFYIGQDKVCKKSKICIDNRRKSSFILPPLYPTSISIKDGACQIINVYSHTFIISLHIQSHEVISNSPIMCSAEPKYHPSNRYKNPNESHDPNMQCLTHLNNFHSHGSNFTNHTGQTCVGKLVRVSWKARKLRLNNFYSTMNLSFLSTRNDIPVESLQSTDIHLKIPVDPLHFKSMMLAMQNCSSSAHIDDIISLSCAWRALAELYPPITMDEESLSCFCLKVFVPLSCESRKQGSIYAYEINSLQCSVDGDCGDNIQSETNNNMMSETSFPSFQQKARKRFMVHRELLNCLERLNGVPSFTISSLLYRLSNDTAMKHQSSQLVLKILNARLVKLKFCSVKIVCNRCYRSLVHRNRHERGTDSERTFWHVPRATHLKDNCGINNTGGSDMNKRTLICPGGCDGRHAVAKWELSCVINDGTGTAKLYANCQSAIMVLGSGLDVDKVEKGAWQTPGGITFKRGIPFKSDIIAMDFNDSSRLRHYNVVERATFELYQHCLHSKALLTRYLDFICRCKKIRHEKIKFQHSEVPIASALGQKGNVVSCVYNSIIPSMLELKSIDSIPSQESPNEIGWYLLKSM